VVTGGILGVDASPVAGGRWLVLESTAPPDGVQGWDLVIDFSGHIDQPNRLSLIRYLHENREHLVHEAAARIDALGQARCARTGKTVVEALQVHEGYSFWYVSGAFEKCIVRNPELGLYLKCLAMEHLMVRHRPRMLATDGLTDLSRRALGDLARAQGVDTDAEPVGPERRYGGFISRLRALARFGALAAKSVRLAGCRDWPPYHGRGKQGAALFVAYSDNLRPGQDDNYDPVYWKGLPEAVAREFDQVEWCHLYDVSAGDSERALVGRMEKLESVAGRPHCLYLLEQGLRPAIVMRAVLMYMRLQWRLAGAERALTDYRPTSGLSPWPFLAVAWQRSTSGGAAASLAVQVLLLERLAKSAAGVRQAYFLCEGMPWERTLLYFWRRNGNGPIYGYQHATVKTCDLRLLSCLPFGPGYKEWLHPDRILCNGPAAGQALRSLGFDSNRLQLVEALRFDYLLDLKAAHRGPRAVEVQSTTVIVLEGIEPIDRFILELVRGALSVPGIASGRRFIIKPHPGSRVDIGEALAGAGDGAWSESREAIHGVLSRADLVCTSINSSAAVEAQALGIPQILIWKPSELIRTPLDVRDWGRIVMSPGAFVEALGSDISCDAEDAKLPVFYLDKALPRWRALLERP
jgi:surface carbohydrate biosynthesis protein (TIGR04326 family)